MHFKLIVAIVDESMAERAIEAGREAGATGVTFIPEARGQGLSPERTFFGLSLRTMRVVILMLVEEHRARAVLEAIGKAANMEDGTGVAFQLDVEDAVGVARHVQKILPQVEEEL
ncbi:MAG: P-II family nitrogen regulator [Zetaproteobacteria bacterium]|nr:MAG: P-II family nitrogen regulator [Zetaproteobacteria bacterium]